MYLSASTLDDLLLDVYDSLLSSGQLNEATKGKFIEHTGVLIELTNPIARLSRSEIKGTIFSCLGELIWYLSGSDDVNFISYYIKLYKEFAEDNEKIHGAYGPRLTKMHGVHDQIENVISLLRKKPTTRQAVIQLFDAADISEQHLDTPCTISLQFILRDAQLHMYTNMRSNDVFRGLPHDIFVFTMLQEIIALRIGCIVGNYKHFVGSLHLYEVDIKRTKKYIEEGFQSTKNVMPSMPYDNLTKNLKDLVKYEEMIRKGLTLNIESLALNEYWKDFLRLLQLYKTKQDNRLTLSIIEQSKKAMSNLSYLSYINKLQPQS